MGKARDPVVAGIGNPPANAETACSAVGCRALLLPYVLFCDKHWRMVPSDLKTCIAKHHRPGKRRSKILETWIARAVAEVLSFQTDGHYLRTGSFQWDDPPAAPPIHEDDGDLPL